MLLMRAAVAAFWQSPYERRLVRWGTRLHDEFMLPHYVRAGFPATCWRSCAALGFPLDPAWFAPHLEFRFPTIGEVAVREHRRWNCATRWNPGTCWARSRPPAAPCATSIAQRNGCRRASAAGSTNATCWPATASRCRWRATERAGEFVAGVRFKAWQPSSALHPTIPAQTPLVFDVYDRWNGRSLGGLTHHVAHPGGRTTSTFPVNANEAEARRRARFFPFGHTPGPMAEPRLAVGKEHPRTLDLRRG